VSETAKRPIEELLADWGELRWEAGENPHFDTERIYVIGDELSARLAQREAQIAQVVEEMRKADSDACDTHCALLWKPTDWADRLSALLDPS
jgi:hypothetical protein